jgi:hypothetical protein
MDFKKIFASAAFLVVGSALPASAALVNPGFELDDASAGDVNPTTGWGSGFNANFTSNDFAHTGTQSLKVFGPFFQFGGAGTTQAQPAVPGVSYTASGFIFSPSNDAINGTNFAVVKVEFLDLSNNVIGAAESPQFNLSSGLDTWVSRSATGVAPLGTVNAQIVLVHVQLNNPVSGGAVFFDDTDLAITPIPEPTGVAVAGFAGASLLAARRRRRQV